MKSREKRRRRQLRLARRNKGRKAFAALVAKYRSTPEFALVQEELRRKEAEAGRSL